MTHRLRNAVFACSAFVSTQASAAPEPSPGPSSAPVSAPASAPASAPVSEVAIAYGKAGVKVGDTPVFAGPVDAAAWDSAQDLVWFTSKSTLFVIDLRVPQRTAVSIAEKMPAGSFGVSGVSTADSGTSYAGVYPVLVFSEKTGIDQGSGAYGGIWEDQDKDARQKIARISIVGTAWLASQVGRSPSAPRAKAATFGGARRVALPKGVGECDDREMCGTATAFGPTPYRLVVISHSCGDACYTGCALYSPASKKYTHPEAGGAWGARPEGAGACEGHVFSPSGTSYLNGQTICRIGATIVCTQTEDWKYVGWDRGAAR